MNTDSQAFPVSKIVVYPGLALEVKRESKLLGQRVARGDRVAITELSRRGLKHLAFVAIVTSPLFSSMLTLTYGEQFPAELKVVKRQLTLALTWIRRKYGPFDYLWFAEFQQRGAIHVHIMLSILPPHGPADDLVDWSRFWANTTVRRHNWQYSRLVDHKLFHVKQSVQDFNRHRAVWQVLNSQEGARRYVAKYAKKAKQKKVPWFIRDVGRFWGTSRGIKDKVEKHEIDLNEDELRQYLYNNGAKPSEWDWLPKYVWL